MLCPLCPGSLGRPWAKFLYPDYGLAHVLGIQPRSCAFGSIQAIGNQLLSVCVLSTHICNSLPEFMLFITFWRGRSFQWRRIGFDLDQFQEVKGKVGIPFVGWFRRTTKKTTHVWWFRRACLYPFSAKHNEGRPRSGHPTDVPQAADEAEPSAKAIVAWAGASVGDLRSFSASPSGEGARGS